MSTTLRPLAAALASVVLTFAAVLVVAGPASAHDQLVSTSPANGSTVQAAPTEVSLTFAEIVLDTDGGTQMKVTDAGGSSLNDGATTVQDNVVTQRIHAATGLVTVLWRAVSEDGHPVSGTFSFTVERSATAPSPTATSASTSTAGSASPVPGSAGAAPGSASPANRAPIDTMPWLVLGILFVAAVGGGIALVLLRRRPRPGDPHADD
jgi:methionine-rich copper-binding protein CopC